MKTLLTSSAVNLAPLHGEWRGQPANPDNPPALFLIGRRGQPACWSPFANDAGNYNVAVTGKSGSGKSVLMQELVTGLIGAGGEAVVIDDGRSFQHTAEALGGAFIAFGKDPACLNPFAMIDAETASHDGDYREECFAMLAGVIGRMARRRGSIDDIEAALIARPSPPPGTRPATTPISARCGAIWRNATIGARPTWRPRSAPGARAARWGGCSRVPTCPTWRTRSRCSSWPSSRAAATSRRWC